MGELSARLRADVERYDGLGVHRYGSPGLEQALDWIAGELEQAGLEVSLQRFALPRQLDFDSATLAVDASRLAVVPQWWMPPALASCSLAAAIAPSGAPSGGPGGAPGAPGGFVHLRLPYDGGAYLTAAHRAVLERAFARQPAAVLLTVDHPSGEIFCYNVDQQTEPWPVPVILVAAKDAALLDQAERTGRPLSLAVRGAMRHDVPGRNVVGRRERGSGRWIVVSTPVSSWFTSTGERAPGIAGFLALARLAGARWPDADHAFVATSGHEIGHGGMARFLAEGAPVPAATRAWAHLGASLACHGNARQRVLLASDALAEVQARTFAGIEGQRLTGRAAAFGELREVLAAGYPRCFGMAGTHRLFHTPADRAAMVDLAALETVVEAFAATLDMAT